jgi:hypothetical protein
MHRLAVKRLVNAVQVEGRCCGVAGVGQLSPFQIGGGWAEPRLKG